jgi:spermidine synthase
MTRASTLAPLLLVGLVSFASLCLEVTLTRLFSVIFFYHFTFLTLSVAFIGASGAGLIAWLLGDRIRQPSIDRWYAPLAGAAGLAMMALLPILKSRSFIMALQSGDTLQLLLPLALVTLPYFLVSFILCIAFARQAHRIGTVYAVDLGAAALGCLLFPLVIRFMGGAATVIVCGMLSLLAVLFMPMGEGRARMRSMAGRTALLLAGLAALVGVLRDPSWEIRPRVARDTIGGPQIERRWSSVSSLGVYPLANAGPDDHFLLIDSLYGTPLMEVGPDRTPAQAVTGSQNLFATPYALLDRTDSIAILGAGAGIDMLRAHAHGFGTIAGIEVNPEIVDVARSGRYAPGFADWVRQPGIEYIRDEARAWLAARGQTWQVIQIPWIESKAAVVGGALAFSENLLFTREAFDLYLRHLEADGLFVIHRYSHPTEPPLQMLRLVSLLLEVVPPAVADQLHRHVLVSALPEDDLGFAVFIYSPQPLTDAQVAAWLELSRGRGDRIDYAPSFEGGNPYLRAALQSADTRALLVAGLPADIEATTDDRPYFFRTTLPFGEDRTNNEIWGILTAVGILSLLFLVLPLLRVGISALSQTGSTRMLFYFVGIGYGFMGIEIGLIHRLMLVLGRPETSLIVVLATLLATSGVGSYLSPRMDRIPALSIRRVALLLCLLSALVLVGFAPLAKALEAAPFALRATVAALLIAPFGLLMGSFFPRAVTILEARMPSLIPWAWSMNGLASVAGSATTLYLSLNLGSSVAMVPAIGAYALVALLAGGLDGASGEGTPGPG